MRRGLLGAALALVVAGLAGLGLTARPDGRPTDGGGIVVVRGATEATVASERPTGAPAAPQVIAARKTGAPDDPGIWATPAEWAAPEATN